MNPEDKEWDRFLDGIGNEVGKLIVGGDPAISQRNFEVFQEKVRAFGKRDQEYIAATEQANQLRAELWERAKADPRLQKWPGKPPKKRWWWDAHCFFHTLPLGTGPWHEMPAKYVPKVVRGVKKAMVAAKKNAGAVEDATLVAGVLETLAYIRSEYKRLSPKEREPAWIWTDPRAKLLIAGTDGTSSRYSLTRDFAWWKYMGWPQEQAVGCWRPPLNVPENPRKWLIVDEDRTNVHPYVVVKGLPKIDNDRELERQYIVLASIYDNKRRGVRLITDVWPEELQKWVWSRFDRCRDYGPGRGYIQEALAYVQADLAKRDGADAASNAGSEDRRRGETWFTKDFTTVGWYGQEYHFNRTQAGCVKILWLEWQKNPEGKPAVHRTTLRDAVHSDNSDFRLAHVFRGHPAWRKMIHSLNGGKYYLGKPAGQPKTPAKKHRRKPHK